MRLIEAMKALKRLSQKVEGLQSKIASHSAYIEGDPSGYGEDQRATVDGWRQSAIDTLAEIARLRMAITRTNLETCITVDIGGQSVSKPIAYWVLRRRELIALEKRVWSALTERNLKPQAFKETDANGEEQVGLRQVIRCYDTKQRDAKLAELGEEPLLIDAALEIANATTELL